MQSPPRESSHAYISYSLRYSAYSLPAMGPEKIRETNPEISGSFPETSVKNPEMSGKCPEMSGKNLGMFRKCLVIFRKFPETFRKFPAHFRKKSGNFLIFSGNFRKGPWWWRAGARDHDGGTWQCRAPTSRWLSTRCKAGCWEREPRTCTP